MFIVMNNQCHRLNLLDFNKWNCLILLCGAIKLIIMFIIIIIIIITITIVHNSPVNTSSGSRIFQRGVISVKGGDYLLSDHQNM